MNLDRSVLDTLLERRATAALSIEKVTAWDSMDGEFPVHVEAGYFERAEATIARP